MTLEEFFKVLENKPVTDYIVRIRLKYDHEEKYRYTNELLLVDSDMSYYWNSDWNEGETDVTVVGYKSVDDVMFFKWNI